MNDEQYFARTPRTETGSASRREVPITIDGRTLHLVTDRGVFSRADVDPGTRVLLDAVPLPPTTGNLLDLGCGWGPIAASMAVKSPNATVWALDVNERAVELTRLNADRNQLNNLRAVTPQHMPPLVRFDIIWSNPPVRIGKDQLRVLLATWLARLTREGEAWLVVNRNLGSDSLAVWLSQSGYRVERLTSKRGYRVLRVRPLTPEADPPAR
jgi:16S rRNA G1207 methylase RsmC